MSIHASNAPQPVGAYPHARRVGDFLLLSGIGPRTPGTNAIAGNIYGAGGALIAYDFEAQCHAVFANVRAVLDASGARWEDLVDITVYLTDMARDFSTYNRIWAEYFPDAAKAPCRTTLGISALPTPIAIELKCMAWMGLKEGIGMSTRAATAPLNFQAWIDAHRHLLKPPVANKCIVDGDFIVMIVGGPNRRSDFHVDEGPEFFYQLEGEMTLRIQQEGVVDVPIRAGEIYYLPPRVPHSPQRGPNSIGLVIERKRLPHELDGLQWYCEKCNHKLYEEFFALESIETQFPAVFKRYEESLEHRTCRACEWVNRR